MRPVARENVRAICELTLADGQERYVAPAAFMLALPRPDEGGALDGSRERAP